MVNPAVSGRPGLTPASLRIVRHAMLVGVLLFGAIAYNQTKERVPLPGDEVRMDLSVMRWGGYGLCVAVVVGLTFIRYSREVAEPARRPTFGLIGSALAEGAAMFAAVYLFIGGGDLMLFGFSVVVFLLTWIILPANSESV